MTDPVAAEGNVAKITGFFQNKINALEEGAKGVTANVQAKGTGLVASVGDSFKNAKNNVAAKISGNVEPSPQGQELSTGLGGPPAKGGRRRRTRKSKKSSSKKSNKRSSRKGKKRSTKKRVRFSRRIRK